MRRRAVFYPLLVFTVRNFSPLNSWRAWNPQLGDCKERIVHSTDSWGELFVSIEIGILNNERRKKIFLITRAYMILYPRTYFSKLVEVFFF